MNRWWVVALLALSAGLNLGLAVLQQRFAAPPPPTVVIVPSPAVGAAVAPAATVAPAPAQLRPTTVEAGVREVQSVREAQPTRSAPAPPGDRAPASSMDGPSERPDPGPDDPFAGEPPPPPFPGAREVGNELGPRGQEGPRPPPGGFRGPPEQKLEEIAARLGVPEKDRPRFIALQRQFLVATRERHFELEAVRRELRAELVGPAPDRDRLRVLIESSAHLQAALERGFVEHVLAARELLDGEAERRYLEFLSRLGPRALAPGGPPGPGRPGAGRPDQRWQRERPWGGRGGGMRRPFPEPRPNDTLGPPPAPTAAPSRPPTQAAG